MYEYINQQRKQLGALQLSAPPLGTPAWVALPDDDPAKLSAVLNAAEAMAYSVNAAQAAEAEASRAISAAADWTAIAKANRDRADFLAANPWARRVVEDGSAAKGVTALCREAENAADNAYSASTPNAAAENEAMDAAVDMLDASTALAATADPWAGRVSAA
ncbi:hypothetical protein A5708_24800 [Mycobacterium colombiense]|uniref:Uncharacterized protein n=1 Tax=Mycobacterium colombiense TaxID=339268 RepID=A0A1A2YUI5_9MYCO|nr:hypothetical protein A5708_24800 [Mycobacterium colombiense]